MNRIVIPLMGALGAALPLLMDSALKGVALLTLAGLLSLVLRKASAAARHLVWLIALGALLALPMLSAMLPGWRVLPSWTLMAPQAAVSPAVAVAPIADEVSLLSAEPMVLPEGASGTIDPASAPAESSLTFRDLVPFVWAAGFILLILRLLAARVRLSQTARRCEVVSQGRLREMMESARRELHISRPVQLLLDTHRSIPMVWGLFRPRMILPAEAVDWEEHQVRSVLLHELAHIKRRDLAAQLLIQCACALYWFNPLVWFAAWRLHVEAEQACDNLVLTHGVRASDYAEHVLHVATRLAPSCGNGVGLAMARSSRLEGRMLAVLSKGLNRRGVTRALILTTLIFGLCVIVPMAMLRAADEKKPADPLKPAPADSQAAKPKPAARDKSADAERADEALTVDIAADGSVSLNGKAVGLKSLSVEITSLSAGNPKPHIEVHVDTSTRFNRVVEVFDELEKSGGSVTIRTPEKRGVSRLPMLRTDRGPDHADTIRQKRVRNEADRDQVKRDADLLRSEMEDSQKEVARLKLRQAESQLKRLERLRAENLIAPQELDEARLEVERTKAESVVGEKSQAELDLARAELALSEANLKRASALFDKNLLAESELDMAKAQVAIARAKLRGAEAKVDTGNSWKTYGRTGPAPDPAKKSRLLEILAAEIEVAEQQSQLVREQRSQGVASAEAVFRAELEVMALQRERAAMEGDSAKVKERITQQIGILKELEQATREQQQQGVSSEGDVLKVRRQILLLQRQQAQMGD